MLLCNRWVVLLNPTSGCPQEIKIKKEHSCFWTKNPKDGHLYIIFGLPYSLMWLCCCWVVVIVSYSYCVILLILFNRVKPLGLICRRLLSASLRVAPAVRRIGLRSLLCWTWPHTLFASLRLQPIQSLILVNSDGFVSILCTILCLYNWDL